MTNLRTALEDLIEGRDIIDADEVAETVKRLREATFTKGRVRGGVGGQTIEASMRSTFHEVSAWDLDQAADTIEAQATEIARLRSEAETTRSALSQAEAQRDAALDACNQARLAFAGYVSRQSAVDKLDAVALADKDQQPAPDAVAEADAWRDVLGERQRQVSEKGWTPQNDDAYQAGDLANAAACYALTKPMIDAERGAPYDWPWSKKWWKPTDLRRDLIKAVALILAEIERLDRAALSQPTGEGSA